MWSAVGRIFGHAQLAFCSSAQPEVEVESPVEGEDNNQPPTSQSNDSNKPSTAPEKSSPKKSYKPLPKPGSFAAFDQTSNSVLGILHSQTEGYQVAVRKQLTPFLAVSHDFNLGIEKFIPKALGASLYTFTSYLNTYNGKNAFVAGVDWFGRMHGTLEHKWDNGLVSAVATAISNSPPVSQSRHRYALLHSFVVTVFVN